ncbi:Histone-lysine N-methyltransferase member suvh2 [Trifolium repens]|nr:Histone-lysine N-methyltransferase member suvh2 [Trifolium repens]
MKKEKTLVLFCRQPPLAAPESFLASTLQTYTSGSLMQFTATSDYVLCSAYARDLNWDMNRSFNGEAIATSVIVPSGYEDNMELDSGDI